MTMAAAAPHWLPCMQLTCAWCVRQAVGSSHFALRRAASALAAQHRPRQLLPQLQFPEIPARNKLGLCTPTAPALQQPPAPRCCAAQGLLPAHSRPAPPQQLFWSQFQLQLRKIPVPKAPSQPILAALQLPRLQSPRQHAALRQPPAINRPAQPQQHLRISPRSFSAPKGPTLRIGARRGGTRPPRQLLVRELPLTIADHSTGNNYLPSTSTSAPLSTAVLQAHTYQGVFPHQPKWGASNRLLTQIAGLSASSTPPLGHMLQYAAPLHQASTI
jgi:hypothetical protein